MTSRKTSRCPKSRSRRIMNYPLPDQQSGQKLLGVHLLPRRHAAAHLRHGPQYRLTPRCSIAAARAGSILKNARGELKEHADIIEGIVALTPAPAFRQRRSHRMKTAEHSLLLLVLALLCGCAGTTRVVTDTVSAGVGGVAGKTLSKGNPLITAAGAAGGVLLGETLNYANDNTRATRHDSKATTRAAAMP